MTSNVYFRHIIVRLFWDKTNFLMEISACFGNTAKINVKGNEEDSLRHITVEHNCLVNVCRYLKGRNDAIKKYV